MIMVIIRGTCGSLWACGPLWAQQAPVSLITIINIIIVIITTITITITDGSTSRAMVERTVLPREMR